MENKFRSIDSHNDIASICANYYNEQFKAIPNCIVHSANLKRDILMNIFNEVFKKSEDINFSLLYSERLRKTQYYFVIKKVDDDIIVRFTYESVNKREIISCIGFYFPEAKTDIVKNFFERIDSKCIYRPKGKSFINIICQEGNGGLYLKEFILHPPRFKIEDNYNDDLIELFPKLVERLNRKNDKGIALFYSKPGNGKTFLIKYLMSKIKKTIIYMPPDLSHILASPKFIPFLMDYTDSILIIEDAENIIKKRTGGDNQSVSNLLNLSDGLLSDVLSIQIIATFNCLINEIDEALLRKGRLITKYEFLPLNKEKSQLLSNKLGKTVEFTEATPLCEIYNQDEINHLPYRKSVGFSLSSKKIETPPEREPRVRNEIPAFQTSTNTHRDNDRRKKMIETVERAMRE